MKVYCWCKQRGLGDKEGPGLLLGSPLNPAYVVEYKGEVVQIHALCVSKGVKEAFGLPDCACDCHREELLHCSFCVADGKHPEANELYGIRSGT